MVDEAALGCKVESKNQDACVHQINIIGAIRGISGRKKHSAKAGESKSEPPYLSGLIHEEQAPN